MRIVFALLLLLILVPSIASATDSALEAHACELDGKLDPNVVNIAPLSDKRVRRIFNDVLQAAEIPAGRYRFVLCEYDVSSAFLFAATSLIYGNVVIVEVERTIGQYDEQVLRGIFGHELGHVYLGHIHSRRGSHLSREVGADRRGAAVVGRDAMLSVLFALRDELPRRLSGSLLQSVYKHIEQRLDALQE